MATNNAIDTGKPIEVSNGGTGTTTFTAHGVLLGEGTSAISAVAAASTGQTLMGNTGADPSFTGSPSFSGSVTAGTGLTVTSGSATITSGNLVVTAGNITLPATNSGRTQGTLVVGGNNVLQFDGTNNSFTGLNSGGSITSGAQNSGYGALSMQDLQSGSDNSALGYNSLSSTAGATGCTSIGYNSLVNLSSTGSYITALGYNAGSNYTSTETSNIVIGNSGVTGESNTIRIGSLTAGTGSLQQNACYITGIDTVNVGSVTKVLTMSSSQIGTANITAGTGISITAGANTITISSSGTTVLTYTLVNTSPYVVLSTDEYLSVDSSGGVITVRLPNTTTTGRIYTVKDKTGSAATNNITITTPGGTVTIDGSTTFVMNTAYESVDVIFNGSNYEIY